MRRAVIIGTGLAAGAVVALTLSRGSVAPLPAASTLDPLPPSTSLAAPAGVDDPVEADEDPPPSTTTTAREQPVPSTTLPRLVPVYDPHKTGDDLPPGYRVALPRDDIKPIYRPVFIEADWADWPLDTLVIGMAGRTEAKAYPVTHLTQREMVNDTLDGSPILVTWCPKCGTAMVHRRELDGRTLVFGNQGDLFGNAMTWWDHDTGSVWSQPRGEAILGPRAGARLELLSSTVTHWGSWLETHPETVALKVPDSIDWSSLFNLEQLAIVVDLGSQAAAYPISELREVGIINDVVAGIEIAVVIDPDNEERWAVFSRRLDDTVVELTLSAEGLVDVASGTVFDAFVGVGRSGALADQNLDKLPAFTIFPNHYGKFYPSDSP
jgi:hypothetical protein